MALGKALRAAMSGPGSCLLMDEDLPIVSRICQAVISDSSIQNRELHFQKEELVYQLSLPKRRWILVKKMDESSSQTAWVPEFCLSKPQPGPYRVNEYLYGKDVGVSQGEIVQITGTILVSCPFQTIRLLEDANLLPRRRCRSLGWLVFPKA